MTFDVNSEYIMAAKCSDDDVRNCITCCMLVREHTPSDVGSLPVDLRRLLLRDEKLTSNLHSTLRQMIVESQKSSLDNAIRRVWDGYERGTEPWSVLQEPNDRWLSTRTASQDPQSLHYNTLDGELLVDGRPQGRLPAEFIRSEIYRSVFGAQIFRVVVADVGGMLIKSSKFMNGYALYFGKRGPDIIIRTLRDSRTLEVVPQLTFQGDLPRYLIDKYIPWLDIQRREIEFRPLTRRWETSRENCWMQYSPTSSFTMSNGSQHLIDMQRNNCTAALGIFGALDTLENLLVTISTHNRLEIALPRYDLHFVMDESGNFECPELCKTVDPNQSNGSLIGLKNRLILCGALPISSKHDRMLIIPDGKPSVHPTGAHVEVRIATEGSKVRLFHYQIDAVLGRLQGDGDIIGILFKAYLHAVSSYVLPDPLTGRTGTEEALSCLRQQSLRFTGLLNSQAITLLELISGLTPRRHIYPESKQLMQRVECNEALWMLSERDDFLPLAQKIISSGDAYSIFHPDSRKRQCCSKVPISIYWKERRYAMPVIVALILADILTHGTMTINTKHVTVALISVVVRGLMRFLPLSEIGHRIFRLQHQLYKTYGRKSRDPNCRELAVLSTIRDHCLSCWPFKLPLLGLPY